MSTNPTRHDGEIGTVRFYGTPPAALFSREVSASLHGVLTRNMVTDPQDSMLGFVSASVDGRPWTNTCWTRDAGVFLRELVLWGDFAHACLLAHNLMRLVRPNEQGYYTFPQHFERGVPGSGSELDGTGAIVIGLELLWERLAADHPARAGVARFLTRPESPVQYMADVLEREPLVRGSGEFGGGVGIPGEHYNVVQNNLVRLALLAAGRMATRMGDTARAARYVAGAGQLSRNMLLHLRDAADTWVWCIAPATLRPDRGVLGHVVNKGFGGINGVLSMSADVLGFDPPAWGWPGVRTSVRTFDRLYAYPLRRALFERYGAWTQFDEFALGYMTGPSYGHGYALQAMLLMDRLDMATRGLEYLAQATHTPQRGNVITRDSDDFFYERYYLPELSDHGEDEVLARQPTFNLYKDGHLDEGCGALNLVCVAEPLKVARLILGVDDGDPQRTRLVPRLPLGWSACEASRWPVLTSAGLARVDLRIERDPGAGRLRLNLRSDTPIPALDVRPESCDAGEVEWRPFADVTVLESVML